MVIRFNSRAEDDTVCGENDRAIHCRVKQRDLKISILKSNLRLILQVISDEDHTFLSCVSIIRLIKSIGSHIAVEHVNIHTRVFFL